jgi:hypothetical protein
VTEKNRVATDPRFDQATIGFAILEKKFSDPDILEVSCAPMQLASDVCALLGLVIESADRPRGAFELAIHGRSMHPESARDFAFEDQSVSQLIRLKLS